MNPRTSGVPQGSIPGQLLTPPRVWPPCDPWVTDDVPYVGRDLVRSRLSVSAAEGDDLFRDDHGLLPTNAGLSGSGTAPPSGQTPERKKNKTILIEMNNKYYILFLLS